jgi:hypothetical protein
LIRSVHAAFSSNTNTTTRPGRASGSPIEVNSRHALAPSTFAASNTSRGRPRKNWRSRKM